MITQYAGKCALCGQAWTQGAEIWLERGMAAVCMGCHNQGRPNPPKGNGRQAAPPASQAQQPGPNTAANRSEATELLREILVTLGTVRDLLFEIRDEARAKSVPQEPEP